MRASVYKKYGNPEVLSLQDVPILPPKDQEIQVKVFASSVNRTDCAALTAKPIVMRLFLGLFKPKKQILGTDFAGVIESIGSKVKGFKVGDRVFGFNDMGVQSHAEFLNIPADSPVEIMPENISFLEMAACIEGAHYARNFINKVQLLPGQKVLIHGATGAIGSAALQIAKSMGAQITATCPSQYNDLILSLGADNVIDYTQEDFTKGSERYDFVFDSVGKSTFGKCRSILKNQGIYISSELGPWFQNPFLALITKFFGSKKVKFPIPTDVPESLRFISQLIKEQKFRAVSQKTYQLETIPTAFTLALSGQKVGALVVDIQVTKQPIRPHSP
jgi:NADPH:quinone reductase-like Zn-dependent oxidoreductase